MTFSNSLQDQAIERAAAATWAREANLVGFGWAASQKVDRGTGVLRVYVQRLLSRRQCRNGVPARLHVPGYLPVAIELEEIGWLQPHAETASIPPGNVATDCGEEPFALGCGIAHYRGDAGTAGCLVRRQGHQRDLFLLSSAHVLRNQGIGQRGDTIVRAGSRQPIGELQEWSPYCFSNRGYLNSVDAAIAKINPALCEELVRQPAQLPSGVNRQLAVGMQVHKRGNATGLTQGVIQDINFCVQTQARRPNGAWARLGLRHQVLCTRFASPGDSGAAVLDAEGRIVGIHFAGTAQASIFNPIGQVFAALELELVTQAEL